MPKPQTANCAVLKKSAEQIPVTINSRYRKLFNSVTIQGLFTEFIDSISFTWQLTHYYFVSNRWQTVNTLYVIRPLDTQHTVCPSTTRYPTHYLSFNQKIPNTLFVFQPLDTKSFNHQIVNTCPSTTIESACMLLNHHLMRKQLLNVNIPYITSGWIQNNSVLTTK